MLVEIEVSGYIPEMVMHRILLCAVVPILLSVSSRADAPLPSASSSSHQDDYRADLAVDGNPSTRWGSQFNDEEQLTLDFREPRRMAGVRIRWEAAYGRDYDLLVSNDGAEWIRIRMVRSGDGGLDEVLFAPRVARFLRIQGVKRGTGWGYSIFEVEVLDPDHVPVASATSSEPDHIPGSALDGDVTTFWRSAAGNAGWIVNFRSERSIGGLELEWGHDLPDLYTVEASRDGSEWKEVDRILGTDGGRDLVFFPSVTARFMRLSVIAMKPVALREISFLDGAPDVSPDRHFESLNSRIPMGMLPRWIERKQTFWTITGVPGDAEETLIGEEGTVEARTGSICVMPFLKVGPAILSGESFQRTHTLEEGYLPMPSIRFRKDPILMTMSAVSHGPAHSSATTVRYRIENGSAVEREVTLYLVAWPLQLNPPWQYGGIAPVQSASIQDGRMLQVNGRPAFLSLTQPSTAGIGMREDGSPHQWMMNHAVPNKITARDSDGLLTVAFAYDITIPARGSRSVVLEFPLHDSSPLHETARPDSHFESVWSTAKTDWMKRLGAWRIKAPGPAYESIMKSNLAYMLLNADYAAAQPGPRNYAKAWMRDGAVSSVTYLRFGFPDVVRRYLDWFTPLVRNDGFVPFLVSSRTGEMPEWARDWKEYDSQGEFIHAVRVLWTATRDAEMVRAKMPAVERVVTYMLGRILERRTPDRVGSEFYGILPESNSHEGYFPGVHSYWDDFWALRGLEDAAVLATALGRRPAAARYRAEEKRLRADLYNSIKRVRALKSVDFIPGCAEKGDFDATSTSIAISACGELAHLRADSILSRALEATYDRYTRELAPRFDGRPWGTFTPYEARNVEAMVRLGRRIDAVKLADFLIEPCMRPAGWNLLPEVVHFDRSTGSYIGDMPHTWVGADLINALRSIFVIDEEDRVELAAGVPVEWLAGTEEVSVTNLPAARGRITWSLNRTAPDRVVFQASGTAKPRSGFVLKHPFPEALRSIRINGRSVYPDRPITFKKLPVKIEIQTY
ncbi:MAG: discoidin domain-containing protein [Candidatus Hydrogenedentota bacterium]